MDFLDPEIKSSSNSFLMYRWLPVLQVLIMTEDGRIEKRSTEGVGGEKGLTEVTVQSRV